MYQKIRTLSINLMGAIPFGVGDFLMNSEFSRNILKLSTGSGIVLALSFLLTPINTRLFSPEDYGLAGMILSVTATFTVLLSFNLNPVILMEKYKRVADSTASLSLILLPISLILCFAALFFGGDYFLELLKADPIKPYLWMVYVGLLLAGVSSVINIMMQREKLYGTISKINVATSLIGHAIRLPWGYLAPSFLGLYIANFVPAIIGAAWSLRYGQFRFVTSTKRLVTTFYKNLSFMTYQTLNAILGTIGGQLPTFWIAAKCGMNEVGYYMMAAQLIDIPCNLLLGSFQTVYYKRVADTVANEPHMLMNLYWRNTVKLTLLGLIPLGCVAVASPFVPWILGERWAPAIPILQLFLLWRLMRFVTAPAYAVITVLRKNKIYFIIQLVGITVTFLGLEQGNNMINSFFYLIVFNLIYWGALILITFFIIKELSITQKKHLIKKGKND